ncbi:MAG TPA: hypothetical protein PKO15_09070 [Fibrobacteria bacterium]|nr:hypothetical protein [Fibrobacteria bacterium]HOX50888.1 hypothetical protein [Fibrobacteria bacterium]
MATLIIERKADARDIARAYKVRVNGIEIAKIRSGEVLSFDVPAGLTKVQMGIDWCGSPLLDVDVKEDRPKVLVCRPNVNLLLALLYVTIWRNRYISLEEMD